MRNRKIFLFLCKRFIAVAEGYDKEENENKQMASEIKNLINDMYAKDFSNKTKIHSKQRREEGSYVGGPPSYGYKAEWKEKSVYCCLMKIQESLYASFMKNLSRQKVSYTAVADELNHRYINPPGCYKKTWEVYHVSGIGEYKGWDKGAV